MCTYKYKSLNIIYIYNGETVPFLLLISIFASNGGTIVCPIHIGFGRSSRCLIS